MKRLAFCRAVLACVLGCYLASFFLPVLDGINGVSAFWFGGAIWIFWPVWLANPLLWISVYCILKGRFRPARNAGIVAYFLSFTGIWLLEGAQGPGYYIWVSSMALAGLGGLVGQAYYSKGDRAGDASQAA